MLAALLFDLDGTLTNSDTLHLVAIQQLLLEEDGRSFTEHEFEQHCAGRANAQMCMNLFPQRSITEHQAFADRKEARFRQLATQLEPIPGATRLLDYAEQHGIGMVVVTNAPRANADHMLAALGFSERLARVVVAEELPHAKPHPLPYLTGLEKLKAEAHVGIAFEDSIPGLTAAKAAGIFTVALATTQSPAALQAAGADLVIDDYNDPRLWAHIEQMHSA
ncbi:HAD-IA family hydrolase [Pseudomonas baltica]|uniref:HAD family hydrolase n=1 Tax=Pseudomonas baltica TaxID=2762576 RepID=UPI0028A1B259|nr:HAD-IA family hydrolase [Pseudomonas baltica]